MTSMSSDRSRHPSVTIAITAVTSLLMAVGASACGGDGNELSQLAQRGKTTMNDNGCASCHGTNGQGGVGPPFVGLAGSVVELDDGSTVVADEAYLLRAILEPDAEVVAGYSIQMPMNGLSEAQAADIVTYIQELATDGNE